MPDYDFSGLSPRSFEQLVQGISARIIGPGLSIFGDGPDGGREAIFEGRMQYPSQAQPWDGYAVVQAKFRQKSQGTGSDGRWALEQLHDELIKFSQSTNRTNPEYYIFCTNVVLTPGS